MNATRTARCARTLCLLLALGPGVNAYADQRDERLDPLFEELREASDPLEAAVLERRIWGIWMQSGDDELDQLVVRGMLAMQRRDTERALAVFDEVVERAPLYAEGWNKRATVHWLRDEYAESMSDIQRTLELEPRHFGALSGMGLIFDELDDPVGALRAFQAVLRINPQARGAQARVEALQAELEDRIL